MAIVGALERSFRIVFQDFAFVGPAAINAGGGAGRLGTSVARARTAAHVGWMVGVGK